MGSSFSSAVREATGTDKKAVNRVARRMTAGDQIRAEKKLTRFIQLMIGLVGYGAALTFLVNSNIGPSSWNVLAEGLGMQLGISFGWATNLIAVFVLLFWIPLKEMPGLGTFLNVMTLGLVADLTARFLPVSQSVAQGALLFGIGLLMLTFFDAVYLGSRYGSGPRDGLMTGAVRVTRKPIWMVRTVIELFVLSIGWLMGGTVGIGTLIVALSMGPLVQFFLRFTIVSLKCDNQDN